MNTTNETVRLSVSASGGYSARLARSEAEVRAAQALRFEVFNLELHEGLEASYATGLDADPFDAVCDHLLVEERETEGLSGHTGCKRGRRRRGIWDITRRRNSISGCSSRGAGR